LPNGLSLNGATGVVSGTPTAAGNFTATFTVTDSTGKTATGSVSFAVHPRTDRVSVDSNGTAGNGASSAPSISGDGSLVAFVSGATNLLAPGIPAVAGQQIYVHNRQTNQIELISRDNIASVVTEGNGVSNAPTMSADGRFVAFVSQATSLLAPGPAVPAGQQIYVRDRQTGLTSLVSVDNTGLSNPGNGVSSTPSISGDGRYVAFVSLATNLLAPDPVVLAGQQIYIRNLQLGQSSLASQDNTNTNVAGTPGVSNTPSTNSNGGFVAFFSQAANLVTAPPTALSDIYVRALP
jgi:Tol biopolymer transport system component